MKLKVTVQGMRTVTGACLALQLLACEDVTSAVDSPLGAEVPEREEPRQRSKKIVLMRDDTDAGASKRHSTPKPDAAEPAAQAQGDEPDADVPDAPKAIARSCPVQISLQTISYGSGDEAEDDYAPNNVGAIWIGKTDDSFVRTVVAWGPTYFDHALTWIDQASGNLVDTVTLPTRASHMRAVEATWDCRDTHQKLVAAGSYRVNLEFTEVEAQGPVLVGERALVLELGDKPSEVVRAPQGFFGEIRVRAGAN